MIRAVILLSIYIIGVAIGYLIRDKEIKHDKSQIDLTKYVSIRNKK